MSQVRVVPGLGDTPDIAGVMSTHDARAAAVELGLDLVEVVPNAQPPVCRIVEYGKFMFELSKTKKKSVKTEIKIVKIRPRTEQHDLAHKARSVVEFVQDGHQVRVIVGFRGRELAHIDVGRTMFFRFIAIVKELRPSIIAVADPVVDGKSLVATLK